MFSVHSQKQSTQLSTNSENLEQTAFSPFWSSLESPGGSGNLQQSSTRQLSFSQQPSVLIYQRSSSHDLPSIEKEEFQLNTFKTKQCPLSETHNRKHCLYFHSENDRRRNPVSSCSYKIDICPFGKSCPNSEQCNFSHNKVEQLYHPYRYKTKYCSTSGKCEYGRYCSFAHNDQEIVISQVLHKMPLTPQFWVYEYKTVWCPYIEKQSHDRAQCVYAHNAQDFRRDPMAYQYDSKICPNWNKSKNVNSYDKGGCPYMENCSHCHGWKEQEYHPSNYRIKKCSNNQMCKKKDRECAYFHTESEKRLLQGFILLVRAPMFQGRQEQTSSQFKLNGPVDFKPLTNKRISNFNGPIVANHFIEGNLREIQNIQTDSKRKDKLYLGQPFEVFSSSNYLQGLVDQRNILDLSSSDTSSQGNQFEKDKKNRTAPSTPELGEYQEFNEVIEGIPIQVKLRRQFSQKIVRLLKKFNVKGAEIEGQLELHSISENELLKFTKNKVKELDFLTVDQQVVLIKVLDEINEDNFEDEQIQSICNQSKLK